MLRPETKIVSELFEVERIKSTAFTDDFILHTFDPH